MIEYCLTDMLPGDIMGNVRQLYGEDVIMKQEYAVRVNSSGFPMEGMEPV